jgi:hypothetical protein
MDANPARAGQAAKVSLCPNGVAILEMSTRSRGQAGPGPGQCRTACTTCTNTPPSAAEGSAVRHRDGGSDWFLPARRERDAGDGVVATADSYERGRESLPDRLSGFEIIRCVVVGAERRSAVTRAGAPKI